MEFWLKIAACGALFLLGHHALKRGITLPAINPMPVLWGLIAFYSLGYFIWNLTRHASFNSFAVDVTLYAQALSNWRLVSPLLGKSLLADHFSPILIFLLPIGKLFSLPWFNFLLQSVLLALPALPLYRIARRWGLNVWPALLMCFVYLNFYFTRQMALTDFRAESFMPLGMLLLVQFFLAGGGWRYWVTWAFCLAIKEDVGFYLFAWAFVLLWVYPEQRRLLVLTAVLSLVVGVGSIIALLPANHGTYPYFSYWAEFGQGLMGIIAGALTKPLTTLSVLFQSAFWWLLLPLAFIPAFSWWGLAGLPCLWLQLASHNAVQADLNVYYVAPVLPLVFAALVAGWRKLELKLAEKNAQPRILLGLVIFLIVFNLHWLPPQTVTPEHRELARLLKKIPPRSSVLTQANVAPHIARPKRVRVFGINPPRRLPDVVVFHMKGNIWPLSRERYVQILNRFRMDPNYRTWKQTSGALILVKKKKP